MPVQVLSETVLKVDGTEVKGHKRVISHPAVKELLASFGRAEAALKKEDLDALMAFYASSYNYHGLKEPDVRGVWGEVYRGAAVDPYRRRLQATYLELMGTKINPPAPTPP